MALSAGKATPDSITVREAAASLDGVSEEARQRQIIELIQRFERIARMMTLTIGWGDLQPKDIARLASALSEDSNADGNPP